ncbi:MAG: PLP-dependent aminotransferase family protein [Geminicoccaceae bacterium]
MNDDNSAGRVTQHLRALAAAAGPGGRLPAVRELMAALKVGPGTVRAAFAGLTAEGLIEARPGQGTFVRATAPPAPLLPDLSWQTLALGPPRADAAPLAELVAPPAAGMLVLSTGYLPVELQPLRLLRAALARAATRDDVWDRLPAEGLEPLRAWFARGLGPEFTARDVLVTPGSQAAVAAVFRGLTAPGDGVVMESPTYIGAIVAARAAGLRVVPLPADGEGVRPEQLRQALHASGARLVYLQPAFANPSGAVLASGRRPGVLEAVREAGAFLVEDDWARELHHDGTEPLPPLATLDRAGHVVTLRTLTKTTAAGLRIGAVFARGAAMARLRAVRCTDDFFVAGALQAAALDLVTAPGWPRHLAALRRTLAERREVLAGAIRRRLAPGALATEPRGGLHLWVRLPPGVGGMALKDAALRVGVVVSPGEGWYPGEAPEGFVRLTFAAEPPSRLVQGVELLAAVLEPLRSRG